MPVGSRPLPCSNAWIDSGVAQTKIPELPHDCKCRHWATSSKLAWSFFVRITPTGLPVQWSIPLVQLQVSESQLTLTKCFSANGYQPGPVPSMTALGSGAGCWPRTSKRMQKQPIAAPQTTWATRAFISIKDAQLTQLV